MITALRLVNFKNFADETLRVGPFTVIVGANASGKSNIRDAFRFLHGIGRGYTLADILGGKYGEGGQREWEGIRGAPNEVVRFGQPDFLLSVELEVSQGKISYSIAVGFDPDSPDGFRVVREELRSESEVMYRRVRTDHKIFHWVASGESDEGKVMVDSGSPALPLLFGWESTLEARAALGRTRFLELAPERMRESSVPGATIMGDSGENLPSVLESICTDFQRKRTLISWLQELSPMDVQDFEFLRDPSGRVHLRIVEKNGRKVSAYSASDGTLRFLAMLAALLGPNPAGVYFFEEIDNGIHPSRLNLLIDLIERQTEKNGVQVITTTHSPDVLNLINGKTFENMSVVSRLEESDNAIIQPVDSLRNAEKLRNSQGLGRLHSTGWMEDMLAFAEVDSEAGG